MNARTTGDEALVPGRIIDSIQEAEALLRDAEVTDTPRLARVRRSCTIAAALSADSFIVFRDSIWGLSSVRLIRIRSG